MRTIDKIYSIPDDDPATYELLRAGKTTGVFQLDTPLGRSYCKKLQPFNLDHLAALVAILRPGCLAKDSNNISMTMRYINRKNGIDPVEYVHPALEPILKNTYGIMIYQEQLLAIAGELADFDLVERDELRKGVGKKIAQEVNRVLKKFVDRAEEKGTVTREQAQQIADWMYKSARYAFNRAHAYSYAMQTYISAYQKLDAFRFFRAHLACESGNYETIEDLISDAKSFDVPVMPPSIDKGNTTYKILDNNIYVGIGDLKGIGESQTKNIVNAIKLLPSKQTYNDILFRFKVSPSTLLTLVEAGAIPCVRSHRKRCAFYINNLFVNKSTKLTEKELDTCRLHCDSYQNIIQLVEALPTLHKCSKPRQDKLASLLMQLKNPPSPLNDTLTDIIRYEKAHIGVALTYHLLDSIDGVFEATHTVKGFQNGQTEENMIFALVVEDVREYNIKSGDHEGEVMAFLKVSDPSGKTDAVIYSDKWQQYSDDGMIFKNARILAKCSVSNRGDSLIINQVRAI